MTVSPLDRARARIEVFREAEAAQSEALFERGETGDTRALASARRALGTGENRADLEEARSLGLLDPATEARLGLHIADVAAAEAIARTGVELFLPASATVVFEGREQTLGTLAREAIDGPEVRTAPRLSAIAARFDRDRGARLEALAAGDEAFERVRARLGLNDTEPERARAARFLAETAETLHELSARARHARGVRGEGAASIALSLRLAGRVRSAAQATTALVAPLGLAEPLSRGVRLSSHGLLSLAPRHVVRRGAPVRVYTSALELGVLGRVLSAVESLQALALALAGPAPVERRLACTGDTLGHALGVMLASGLAQPPVVARSLGEESRDAQADAAAAALALLLVARLAAARVVALHDAPGDEEARVRGAAVLGLREPLPSSELVRASTALPTALRARARAIFDGLAATAVLRERFDVDWARNPRVEHVARAAAQLGPSVPSERWLADLGGRPDDAFSFGRSLAGG